MTAHNRTRAVAYLRVSTDKQADRGVSLEVQREKVSQYAALYDLEIVDVIEDAGHSGKSLQRPGLQRALSMLRSRDADALLVVKLDRLTRSVRDLGALVESTFPRSALLSVSEQIDTRTAAGRLVLNVLASVSQWEREAIAERTAMAMRHMRDNRRFTGGQPPFGSRLGPSGELVDDPGEQAIVADVRRLDAEGMSVPEIAASLSSAGHVSRSGKCLSRTQVRRILQNADREGITGTPEVAMPSS